MLLAAELIHVMKCSPYIRGNYRLDRMALPVSVGVYVFSFIYVFVGNGTGKRLYVMKSKYSWEEKQELSLISRSATFKVKSARSSAAWSWVTAHFRLR